MVKKKIALALQGAVLMGLLVGSFLDRLLEDERIEVKGLTGTSAGGMNAVAVAQGLTRGNNQTARTELKTLASYL